MFLAWPVPEDRLKDAAMQSGLLDFNEEYIPSDVEARCKEVIPDPTAVKPKDCADAFLYLKNMY